jgi:hypothetical protein
MEEDQNGTRNQQSDSIPNKLSAENCADNLKDKLDNSHQVIGKGEENTTFPRRPQFRLTENCKKRYI